MHLRKYCAKCRINAPLWYVCVAGKLHFNCHQVFSMFWVWGSGVRVHEVQRVVYSKMRPLVVIQLIISLPTISNYCRLWVNMTVLWSSDRTSAAGQSYPCLAALGLISGSILKKILLESELSKVNSLLAKMHRNAQICL
jgi:hypothetical protein